MIPPQGEGPQHPDGDRPGCQELARAVDDAVGVGYDRAFDLLEDITADTGNGCICRRCRTRTTMLGVVWRRELRLLDERLSGHWMTPP